MATTVYDVFINKTAINGIRLDTASVKAILVKSTTTCGAQNGTINTLADFTTLGELVGTGYARQDVQNLSLVDNRATHRTEWHFDPINFGNLQSNNGTAVGALLYQVGTNMPIIYHVFPTPLVTNGVAVILTPDPVNGDMWMQQGP